VDVRHALDGIYLIARIRRCRKLSTTDNVSTPAADPD
jgi:hypothetical protein